MFRAQRTVLIGAGLVLVVAGGVYALTRSKDRGSPGPYAAQIERLHQINHEMRNIWHGYKSQHEREDAFQRWHDLLHEEKELLHTLPKALNRADTTESRQ